MLGRHRHLNAGTEGGRRGPALLSCAYLEGCITDEEYAVLGPGTRSTVVFSLVGSWMLGAHPQKFGRDIWTNLVSYNAATFQILPPDLAEIVLNIGVRSGLLSYDLLTDTFSIPEERALCMESLFDLLHDPGRPFPQWRR